MEENVMNVIEENKKNDVYISALRFYELG